MLRCLFLLVMLGIGVESLSAHQDSVTPPRSSRSAFLRRVDRITSTRAYQMTYIGVPLVLGAVIVKREDAHFRNLRQGYAPSFNQHYDDYLQYSPAAIMLGLKACGVQSRSSWGRLMVSSAFSVGLMTAVVNATKYSARVMRPDGSSRNSFPSGHTATAFMAATLLHKEYGWRSPWYSVAGYTVATVTGVSRMLNNRHWLSDVLAGAGIGILTTELGYFLADLIYQDRGIRHSSQVETFDFKWNPSFVGFFLGLDMIPGVIYPTSGAAVDFRTGAKIGLEGAWFMNPYVGIGGSVAMSSMSFIVNGVSQIAPFKSTLALGGAYFSYPLSRRWLIGSKLLAGYSHYERYATDAIQLGATGNLALGTGISMMYRAKYNLGIRFYCDYTLAPPIMPQSRCYLNVLTLGSSVNILF